MQLSQAPSKFAAVFGNAATFITTPIPINPTGTQAASLSDGFPLTNFTPASAGGIPNRINDFNGILNQITGWDQWYNAGGSPTFDSAFSAEIGGYPYGAILASATTPGNLWLSLVDNNTQNPDTAPLLPLPSGSYNTAQPFGGVIVNTSPQWIAIPGIINTNVSYTVGPPTVTQTDSGVPAGQFNDLNTALAWLNQFRISDNGSVTFNLQGIGSYGPSTYLVGGSPLPYIIIDHPNASRLTITGHPAVNWQGLANNLVSEAGTNNYPNVTAAQFANIHSPADLFNINNITINPTVWTGNSNYTLQNIQRAQINFFDILSGLVGTGFSSGVQFLPLANNYGASEYGLIIKTPGVTLQNLFIMGSSIAVNPPNGINPTLLDIRSRVHVQNVGVTSNSLLYSATSFNGACITVRGGGNLVLKGPGTFLAAINGGWNALYTGSTSPVNYPSILIEDGGSLSYGASGSGVLLSDGTTSTGNQNIIAGWGAYSGIQLEGSASFGPEIGTSINVNVMIQGCSAGIFNASLNNLSNTAGISADAGSSVSFNSGDSINISYNAANGLQATNKGNISNGTGIILNYNAQISGTYGAYSSDGGVITVTSAKGGAGTNPGANSNVLFAQVGSFIDGTSTSGNNLTTNPTANTVGNQRSYVEQT